MNSYPATREAGLARLKDFVGSAGEEYASRRSHVPGTVSGLSPYIRHRLVSEEEVAREVLARHSFAAAEKFLQEVCWRTYWKGWLEMRPEIWFRYLNDLHMFHSRMAVESDFAESVQRAEEGKTGLDCFDVWSHELRETGYLHNHVRMWFASIWIHTLRLPWQLGADFFMRHLLDGDPASNTLSWRWVCGLQTKGKVYKARSENITTYTSGRFHPKGLDSDEDPEIPKESSIPEPRSLPVADQIPKKGEKMLILGTVEDLTPCQWGVRPEDVDCIVLLSAGVPGASDLVNAFRKGSLEDAAARYGRLFGRPAVILDSSRESASEDLKKCLQQTDTIVQMSPAVGLMKDGWEKILPSEARVLRIRRSWDSSFWPHATHGFFRFRESIPKILKSQLVNTPTWG